jgi:sulfite exporter TauE/SafE
LTPEILTAFTIGFLGSFHCIGMCGPIAIALPVPKSSKLSFFTGRILYNVGRVVTYSCLGLLFGLVGGRIALAGAQQVVSIILGVAIVIAVLLPQQYKNIFVQHRLVQKLAQPLKSNISILFKKGTLSSLFLIGILNGFLPCGFVYIGLAGSIASGNAISGAAVMMLFGLGTVPAMFAATVFGKFINIGIRAKLRKIIPVFAILLAAVFIMRAMNLGIPFLSPKLSSQTQVINNFNQH